ncbi:MAG: PspC domain-containing protein [Actinomycetota bacterium]|nr:PspC domain-containing protein [Actinomycetota bacterium]
MALKRNSKEGWVAGVCAGLAPTSGLPVMLLRAAFVLIPGAWFVYVALWILMPDED